jgi:tellurite resistance protein
VIAYVNGQGAESRRRILVRALKLTSDDGILLLACCTETRKEMRFRADRIKHCVDINGEVQDQPAALLADVFNLDPVEAGLLAAEGFTPPAQFPPADTVYSLLRRQLGHDLTLMAAMAESDGQISMIEADAILNFVRRRSDLFGIDLDETRVRKLLGFVRRVRPTEDQIRESLDEIGERSPKAKLGLLTACRDVRIADGEIHAREVWLLDQICEDLVDG